MNTKLNEHIVKDGTYIPDMGFTYPEQPDEPLLNPPKVRDVDVEHDFPFLDRSFKAKLRNFFIYFAIFTVVFILNKIKYGIKFEGKENLKKHKDMLKNGAMTIANHVNRWDFLMVLQAIKFRRMWFPARTSNIETSDAGLILGAGGIPIPKTLGATRHFNEAFDTLVKENHWIHVFPESCRWDWYEPIRPFKLGAFKMANRYKYPIVPIVITYRKPTGIWKFFGVKHPLITVKIGEPLSSEKPEGVNRTDFFQNLRKEAHSKMCALAGIEKNCWEAEGD